MDEKLRKVEREAKSDSGVLPQYIRALYASSDPLGLLFRGVWWSERSGQLRDKLGVPGEMMETERGQWKEYELDGLTFQVHPITIRTRPTTGPRSVQSSKIKIVCPMCSEKTVMDRRTKKKVPVGRIYDVGGFTQHSRTHLPKWIPEHFKFEYIEIRGVTTKMPRDLRRLDWLCDLVTEVWGEGKRKNPLRAKHEGVQSSNPVPEDVEVLFRQLMGRGLRPEDHEGIHAANFAAISVEYAISAAEAHNATPALVTLDSTGLTPSLDAEGIAIKKLLSSEWRGLITLIEMVDSEEPDSASEWLNRASEYYEFQDVNPISILQSQFWRSPEESVSLLREWVRKPNDLVLMNLIGSRRYLHDISATHIVAIEELVLSTEEKMQVKPLFTRPGAPEQSPAYLYHGTTLENLRKALEGELLF